jgi:hypothetical protein
MYKNKPLNEKIIRSIMKKIELKGKSKKVSMEESLDMFLKRGSKMTVAQLLKEVEVADDYDPSETGIPDFVGQELDIPFEGDNDSNADYVSDESEPDEPNPDVDSDASAELISEKRKAKLKRKENYFKKFSDDGFIEEDTDVSDIVNGDYVDYEDNIDIDDYAEGEEDIYYDNPSSFEVEIDDDFDEDELFPEDEYEDFIIEEDEDEFFLFEDDDEVEDEGENEVIAEAKKKKKEDDDDKEKEDDKKDDKEKEDDKKDDKEKEDDKEEDDKKEDDKKIVDEKINSLKESDEELEKLANEIKKSKQSLMGISKIIDKLYPGKLHYFSFDPFPHYKIKSKKGTIIIVNKNYADADENDILVGEMVIGRM